MGIFLNGYKHCKINSISKHSWKYLITGLIDVYKLSRQKSQKSRIFPITRKKCYFWYVQIKTLVGFCLYFIVNCQFQLNKVNLFQVYFSRYTSKWALVSRYTIVVDFWGFSHPKLSESNLYIIYKEFLQIKNKALILIIT